MGNAAAVAQLGQGRGVRDRNLPFHFNVDALQAMKPADLAEALRRSLHTSKVTDKKDGADLSDSEKLFEAVRIMVGHGVSGDKLRAYVVNLFFDKGDPARGRDEIATVSFSGSDVTIEFRSPGGYAFNQGAIIPMVATAPVVYKDLDTNERGARVGAFQASQTIAREGSWLASQRPAMEKGFVRTPEGIGFAKLTQTQRDNYPAYKAAFWEWQQELARDYMIRAPYWVKQQLSDRWADAAPCSSCRTPWTGPSSTRTPTCSRYLTGRSRSRTKRRPRR